MTTPESLAKQLKNVGPVLAGKMIRAGIDSPEKLRALGAREAFMQMYAEGDKYGDYNAAYLYALEGAIRDCAWSEVPTTVKDEFKDFAQSLQRKKRAAK